MRSGADVRKRLLNRLAVVTREANERTKNAAQAMVDYLAAATPVDTSKALSNWIVGIGSPVTVDFDAHVVGEGGSTRGASVEATRAAAASALRGKKPGQIVWVSNSDPNIVRLNAGSSKQAAAGFAEVAIMIGKAALARRSGGRNG